jgi:F-type H+-transporting ATPase subunit gamma
MQMVAASKMRRAQENVLATRDYSERAWRILTHLASQRGETEELHPLLRRPESLHTVAMVLITGNRGLCGGYNHNILRVASDYLIGCQPSVELIAVGRRGASYMARYGRNVEAEFTELPDQPRITDITPIARLVLEGYREGRYDMVVLAYTDFINTLSQKPTVKRLLPVVIGESGEEAMAEYIPEDEPSSVPKYIYEPDARTILDTVVPRFVELRLYQALLESAASEHSARMVAMRNATENAMDLIEDLTLTYNQARQQDITNEMLDIAGGAEALRQAQAMAAG